MSSNNNQDGGMAFALALVGAGLALIGIFLFAVLAFLAVIMTILALCAWMRPLKLGSITIKPRDARLFIYRGLAGAILVPAFVVFSAILIDFRIDPDWWFYMVIGGYVLGSVGIAILEETSEDEEEADIVPVPAPRALEPPARVRLEGREPVRMKGPARSAEPFRFASWDDEEEFK
ncbi:hypothetical protein [Jiella pelagia]|uniref:Uncharacterized protein n=1 Tax=Jiella pelagia TaxID=2986949 RepID=A0ABY7BY49_9HYPH|nr:hypothetical protein [Jiella pelagia]WAP67699.1 hypothetical protein OH818_19790 [Jiella pelagia]